MHKSKVSHIKINKIKENEAIFYCEECISNDEEFKPKDFVRVKEILESQPNSIVKNWPPIRNQNLLKQAQDIIKNNKDRSDQIKKIEDFFSNLKGLLYKKIDECQKKILSECVEYECADFQFLQIYREVEQIDIFQQVLKDNNLNFNQKETKCKEFINSKISQQEKFSEKFQRGIDQRNNNQHQFDTEIPNQLLEKILSLILEINFFRKSTIKEENNERSDIPQPVKKRKSSQEQKQIEIVEIKNESLMNENNESLMKENNESLMKENNESQMKENNESQMKDNNESQMKENNESIMEENNESQKKENINNNQQNSEQLSYIIDLKKNNSINSIQPIMPIVIPDLSVILQNDTQKIDLLPKTEFIKGPLNNFENCIYTKQDDNSIHIQLIENNYLAFYLSNIILKKEKTYILRFKINNPLDTSQFYIGLVNSEEISDYIAYFYYQFNLKSQNQTLSLGQNTFFEDRNKIEYGNFSDLPNNGLFEMTVCINKGLFQLADFPDKKNMTSQDHLVQLNIEENLKFFIILQDQAEFTLVDAQEC